jgi:hypothetical protein
MLSAAGFSVQSASSVEDVVEQLAEGLFDVCVIDAGLGSSETHEKLASSAPERPWILTATEGWRPLSGADRGERMDTVVKKPFLSEQLVGAVASALSGSTGVPGRGVFLSEDARRRLQRTLDAFLEAEAIPRSRERLWSCVSAFEGAWDDAEISPVDGRSRREEQQPEKANDAVLEGCLSAIPVDQVFQLCVEMRQTSRCSFQKGDLQVDVFFERQGVVFARQHNLHPGFRLGGFLMQQGLDASDVDGAIGASSLPGDWLGRRLRAEGRLTQAQLEVALTRQIESLVYEVIRWSDGTFRLFLEPSLPAEAREVAVCLQVPHLLLEGMRRLDEWGRMPEEFVSGDAVFQLGEQEDLTDGLSPDERRLLADLKERPTLRELFARARRPTYDLVFSLRSLAGRRLVSVASGV